MVWNIFLTNFGPIFYFFSPWKCQQHFVFWHFQEGKKWNIGLKLVKYKNWSLVCQWVSTTPLLLSNLKNVSLLSIILLSPFQMYDLHRKIQYTSNLQFTSMDTRLTLNVHLLPTYTERTFISTKTYVGLMYVPYQSPVY